MTLELDRPTGENQDQITRILATPSAEALVLKFLLALKGAYVKRVDITQAEIDKIGEALKPLTDQMNDLQSTLSPERLIQTGENPPEGHFQKLQGVVANILNFGNAQRQANERLQRSRTTIDKNIEGLINLIIFAHGQNGPTELPLSDDDFSAFIGSPIQVTGVSPSPEQVKITNTEDMPLNLDPAPIAGLLGVIVAQTEAATQDEFEPIAKHTKRKSVHDTLGLDWSSLISDQTGNGFKNEQYAIRVAVNYITDNNPKFADQFGNFKEKTLLALTALAVMNEDEFLQILKNSFKNEKSAPSLARILAIKHYSKFTTKNSYPLSHKLFENHAKKIINGSTNELFPEELIKESTSIVPRLQEIVKSTTTPEQPNILTSQIQTVPSDPDIVIHRNEGFPTTPRHLVSEITNVLTAFRGKAQRERVNLQWPTTSSTITKIDTRIKSSDIDAATKKGYLSPTYKEKNKIPMFSEQDVAILLLLEKYKGKLGINETDLKKALKLVGSAYNSALINIARQKTK